MASIKFPENFLWGCSTAAYQIEGSPTADGAGASIWHRFSHTPGKVLNGDTGDVACDHYNRYRDDVKLMRDLGMQAYRFSIAWGRVLPDGTGKINKSGLDFYQRLVDELLQVGITPMATLYHWDLPQALDNRGGWLNPDIAEWFGDFAELIFKSFDDRVPLWNTLNEPWVTSDFGYLHGNNAPGHNSHYEAAIVSHNLMRANAEAVRRYRSIGKNQIGLAVNLEPKYPASNSRKDLLATQRAEAYMNRQYLDAALLGQYPPEMEEVFGDAWLHYSQDELDMLKQPLDFIGINYYTRGVTRYAPENWPLRAETVRQPMSAYTDIGLEVYPQALTDVLNRVKDRYDNPPVYITENGSAFYDPPVAKNNRVEDRHRQSYMCSHIQAVHKAIQDGCDVRGYFAWSLMDNFEWAFGYSKRFGLVHINYETLQRTPKDSAKLYKQVIESNGQHLDQ